MSDPDPDALSVKARAIFAILESMATEDDRLRVLAEVSEFYCLKCGRVIDPRQYHCACYWNDYDSRPDS